MSYAVVHMQKIKTAGVKGIQFHNQREKISKSNLDIDKSKSHLNYDLKNPEVIDFNKRVNQIIKDEVITTRAIRKDAVKMCNFIVSSDTKFFQELSDHEQKIFFEKSYDFFKNRYGENKIVSAVVHLDEKTPHMHLSLVPITQDKKLSAKRLFDRNELRSIQDEFPKFIKKQGFNLERGLSAEGKNKHLSVQEFKIETKFKELKDKKVELEKLENIDTKVHLKAEKNKLMYSSQEVGIIKEQNRALKLENYKKNEKIQELNQIKNKLENHVLKTKNIIIKAKVPLERSMDLEDEFKAFKVFLKQYPEIVLAIEPYNQKIEQAYTFGNGLYEFKKKYNQAKENLKKNIEQTYNIAKIINEYDINFRKLSIIKIDINESKSRLNNLENELKNTKGIFKNKQRKELTNEIKIVKIIFAKNVRLLKTDLDIDTSEIAKKRKEILSNKEFYEFKKSDFELKSIQLENIMTQNAKDYKYYRAISNVQDKNIKSIINRRDDKISMSYQDKKLFEINKSDRNWITEKLKEKNPNYLKRIENFWKTQDKSELIAKKTKSLKRSKNISRSGMER